MAELFNSYRGTVYPWHCDHMGHMNVMWYIGKFDEATWQFFTHVGLTPSYLRDHARGMVAVHQEVDYLRELRAGDSLAIFSRALEVRPKVARFMHEMRNVVTDEIAATTILTGVHIDTQTRKSVPLPAELFERIQRHVEEDSAR